MILASQSPRRSQLLSEAGFSFRCVPARIDERSVERTTPEELVRALACAKAGAVAGEAGPGEPVVGSDTAVVLDGDVLGKPADANEARAMLRRLSGRTHEVVTGVSVWRDGAEAVNFAETARVEFWDLLDAEIDAYVATGEPFDKAGAYGIQGRGRTLVKGIAGDFYTVVGLPISRLVRELRALGVEPDPQGA